MNTRSTCCLALGGLLLSVLGCGGSVDPNRPKTYPVTGQVLYNGDPVEDATVMFVGSGTGGRGALGKTDASGNFSMTTYEAGDGAIPGTYRVSIFKTLVEEVEERPGARPNEEPIDTVATELLPAKYKDINRSGLTAEVTEGGENNVVFNLTD